MRLDSVLFFMCFLSNNFGSIQSSDENYIESKSYELEYGYLSYETDKELYEGRYTGIN